MTDAFDPVFTVAQQVAADLLSQHAVPLLDEVEWSSYPEIGMYDWENVVAQLPKIIRLAVLTVRPEKGDYDRAYQALADRARIDF
jgi:hypothetical protein